MLTVGAGDGELGVVPEARQWTVLLHGFGAASVDRGTASVDGGSLRIELGTVPSAEEVSVRVWDASPAALPTLRERLFDLLHATEGEYLVKDRAWDAVQRPGSSLEVLQRLEGVQLPDALRSAMNELLLADC